MLGEQLWINAHLITMDETHSKHSKYEPAIGVIENGAIACTGDRITWLGEMSELSEPFSQLAQKVHDVNNQWITPGLIDCHTHLVYAGNRSAEFSQRARGLSYEQIAEQGGGILNTVRATRRASFEDLYQQSAERLQQFLQEGVTTIEIKSGYGLEQSTEIKQLAVAKKLSDNFPMSIQRTCLAAHIIPPEYEGRGDAYIDFICTSLLPELVAGELADAIDIFCEKMAFNLSQAERLFKAAQQYSLKLKIHAEQFSNMQATALAARYGALSADHLEYLNEPGVVAMANSKMVAVLLPGAYYYLKESQKPPLDLLRQYKVPIAIASDCNPGSSPISSIQIMMNMACNLFDLSPEEALLAVTKYAAQALGLTDRGILKAGKKADFALWNISHPAEIGYFLGINPCSAVVKGGDIIFKPIIKKRMKYGH